MRLLPLLLCLLLNSALGDEEWEPLGIGVVYEPHPFFVYRKRLVELEQAVLNLNQLVRTRPIPVAERQQLGFKDLVKCAPQVNFRRAKMFGIGGGRTQLVQQLLLRSPSLSNFFILLEFNGRECLSDPNLLAGAKPCFYDVNTSNRPSMSRMIVCLNNQVWKTFRSGYDLFRHEILHALGFGMLFPQSKAKASPKPQQLAWRAGLLTYQLIETHYLDFAERAIHFARVHFNCNTIDAIPADDSQKFHLNEYYFGNELMTPILSDGRNYFTHLSASILESTHFGNVYVIFRLTFDCQRLLCHKKLNF